VERDLDALERERFDLLVVGGGVYGAWTAYDAALRGLRVALIEAADFAAGTSSASSKLIHGGLRYLDQLQFGLVRKALAERARLLALGPHRVRALTFLMPRWSGDRPGRAKLRLGLWLYDRLGGACPALPRHRWLGAAESLARVDLRGESLAGALLFGDGGTDDARMVLELIDGAREAGAIVANGVRATELVTRGARVAGAAATCRESGRRLAVDAALTVVCAGPWAAELVPELAPTLRRTKGVHLVLPALRGPEALLLGPGSDDRIVFLIPWYGRTLLGTTDTDFAGPPEQARVEPEDRDYLLARAARALRTAWTPGDVIAGFAGLRTLPASAAAAPSAVPREWHLSGSRPGLLAPVGGKYTSARHDAAEIVDRALALLGRPHRAGTTGTRPLPWCPTEPFATWRAEVTRAGLALGLPPDVAGALAERHGARASRLHRRIAACPDLGRRIVPGAPFCRAEIVHAVEHEMARSLEDLLRRRVPLLLVAPPGPAELDDVSRLAAHGLGWSAERRAAEVASVAGCAAARGVPR